MRNTVLFAVVLFLILYPIIEFVLSDNAFITNDQCKQSEVFLWQKNISISADCDCPPNFVALITEGDRKRKFCLMVTKPQRWSNVCVSSGSTDDYYEITVSERNAVNEFLRGANVLEFWISVQREGTFDPPLKKLPGTDWGTPLDFSEDYDLEISQRTTGNCLKANIAYNYPTAQFEDCNKQYPQLCVYKKDTMLRLYCPPNEYTTRYSALQDHCFRIERASSVQNSWDLYDISSHRKFQLYNKLASEIKINCNSSIIQSNLTFHLQQAFLDAGQGSDELYYVAMHSNGMMMLTKEFDCAAFQSEINNFKPPEIKLNFDRLHKKLLLVISNGQFLWRDRDKDVGVVCYTDADTELLKNVKIKRKVWPPHGQCCNNEQEIYELKLYGDFPGTYWCEGHAVPNFTLVKSERIIAQKKESNVHIYSVLLEIHSFEMENVWQKKSLKQLVRDYMEYLQDQHDRGDETHRIASLLKGMQVMKIELIDHVQKWIRTVVHVSAKYDDRLLNVLPIGTAVSYIDQEEYIRKHYQLKELLRGLFESTSNDIYQFKGINSTEMCLPPNINVDGLKWPSARIGQTVVPQELCLIESSGLPLRRKCLGDRTYGGVWQQYDDRMKCSSTVNAHTLQLYNYNEESLNPSDIAVLFDKVERIMNSAVDIIPADIFYLSKTMDNLRSALLNNSSNQATVIDNKKESYYCGIAGLLNRVMYMNETVVLRSQVALNTTNILLDSTDDIINQLSVVNSSYTSILQGDSLNCLDDRDRILTMSTRENVAANQNGTILFRTPRLILLVADPSVSGVSGVALIRMNETNVEQNVTYHSFDAFSVRLIAADETEESLLEEEDLEIAAYIPRSLLEKIEPLNEHIIENITTSQRQPLRIVISMYFNDNIFRETTNGTILRANSKIISVTIPGYGSDLPGELPVFFREEDSNLSSSCGYWNFEPDNIGTLPKWSFGGCNLAHQNEQLSLCKCSHLTPFSRLCMDIQLIESEEVSHKFIGEHAIIALDIITAIGSALSLVGVIGIFLTATMFPTWRSTANSKILLQLSLAIAIEMVIIFLDGPDIDYNAQSSKIECTLLGGAFHYIILVTFMWMLVIAYLQFLRYVKVLGRLRPSRFILKASIFSWCVPLVPVLLFATIDYTVYHKQDNISDICYPHGTALYYGLLLPIAIVILMNMASFLLIIYNVFKAPDNVTRSSDRDLTISQIRLSVFLFFLLGLPWIFGMLITVKAGKVFSYLFCLTAPLQGFVLFVYFIIMDPTARKFWCSKCNKNVASKNAFDMTTK